MKTVLRRAALAVASVAAIALVPVAVSAPASAAVTGSTSSDDAVLYPQCQQHDVDYSIQVSSDTTFWNLEIQIESPAGLQSGGIVLSSTKQSPTQGTLQFSFCGSEQPGTWTVKAAGIYQFFPGVNNSYALPDSTFDVRSADTRTGLKAKQKRGARHRVKLVAIVRDERADGFDPTEGAPIDIERLVNGSWQKVRGSAERSIHGRTTTYVRAQKGDRYRAVTSGVGNYAGSVSAPVAISLRRH